jgi:hypothetical protein
MSVSLAKNDPVTNPPWLAAYKARSDLEQFGDNAIGLFALALRFNIEDIASVGSESITDGSDDKKCDLIYIDIDQKRAIVAQCYMSAREKGEAPANKASDLNTAANWLLLADSETLPERIKFSAIELRKGLANGDIERLSFWYVHNLPESKNVANELKTLEHTVKAACKSAFSERKIVVNAVEVGVSQFEIWYSDTQSPILVTDTYKISIEDGFEVKGDDWHAYVTAFPLQFLRSQYSKHGTKLFSANVRDYLGSISSDANINNGIKKTAETEPENFWPYNNGLTILVNSFHSQTPASGKKRLIFSGMSIVNGAQTTGALATLIKAPPATAKVAVRMIKTENQEILYNIIRYNNSQNKVAAADFRSTDQIQKRLRKEMGHIPAADYDGGRRGGPTDAIKRRPNLLASSTVGQALAALHGDATVAYNQKSDIWIDDGLYSRYFNEQTTASHIVFCHSLLRAIEAKKVALINKSKTVESEMTESETRQLSFFRRRGATFLLVTAIAYSLEPILGKKIPNLFRLSFGIKISPLRAQQIWAEIVDAYVPLCSNLEEAFTTGLQNQEKLKSAVTKFASLVEVMAGNMKVLHKKFSNTIIIG